MKKKITLILCVVMVLTMLCGCGEDGKWVKPEEVQRLYADMDIQSIDEMNTELTLLEDVLYDTEIYDEEFDPKYMTDIKESYTTYYVIDSDEENCNRITQNYVDYLYAEGYECIANVETMSGPFVTVEKGDYIMLIVSVGEMQWEGYEGQCGITITVYK